MQYISPISQTVGIPTPINYNPLASVENVNLNISDDANAQPKTTSLWEFLAHHIDNHLKLPNEVRDVLIKTINPQVSLSQRLELPFRTINNELAIEVFWGNQRVLVFDDPKVNDLVRCVVIPYDSTDPENYLKSIN